MTVTYTGRVASANLCVFSRLLLCWKGSIYKLMYKEMLIFCSLYSVLSLVYRLALNDDQKRVFEHISMYCRQFTNLIPLGFVLGFYVSVVVARWWSQFMTIPWPDRVVTYLSTVMDGTDQQSRILRRMIVRYLSLASLIVFQATSVRVKKRFPTMDHILEAGMITTTEMQMLGELDTPHGKWWVPFVWATNLVRLARKQGRIPDNYLMKTVIEEIVKYRENLGMLYCYDWISIPLVYTQVTSLAVYTFFAGCLFGRQFLDPTQGYEGHEVDLFVPFFTLLQFFFYVGWLKVAEQLINPFGEDDDDFEMNWIIDRNLQISLLVVDQLYGQTPPIEKDIYYGLPPPESLPYTKSSAKTMSQPHMGSTADLRIADEDMKFIPMETIDENEKGQNHVTSVGSGFSTPGRVSMTSRVYGRHRPDVLASQNLMSGILSPVAASNTCSDVIDHLPGTSSVGSSVVTKVTDKLKRWLVHHRSRSGDLNVCRSCSTIPGDCLPPHVSSVTFGDLGLIDDHVMYSRTPPVFHRTRLPPLAELTSPRYMFDLELDQGQGQELRQGEEFMQVAARNRRQPRSSYSRDVIGENPRYRKFMLSRDRDHGNAGIVAASVENFSTDCSRIDINVGGDRFRSCDQKPEVVIDDVTCCSSAPATARIPPPCESTSVIGPEDNQLTVTSLTPLLQATDGQSSTSSQSESNAQ